MRGGGKGGGVDHKSEVRLGIHPARTPPRRSRGNQPGAHRATDLFEPVWEGRLLSAPPRTFARGPGRSSDALWSGRIAKESVRGPWHSYSGSIFDEAAGKKLRSGFGTEFLCISAAQGKRVPKYLVVVVELMAVLVTGAPGRCCCVRSVRSVTRTSQAPELCVGRRPPQGHACTRAAGWAEEPA